MKPLVEVKDLRKKFGELVAVDSLSFSVMQGDVYGFLGQNGAGKSTTIRMLLTLIRPDSGSIKMFGKELAHNREEILSHIGAIIERPDQYKYLSALDNLKMFAKLSGLKPTHKELMDQLDKVGLGERAASKVQSFSQGMKQRLGIAIALVHDPQLIILDEPTNGLDPQGIADMRHLIIDLSKTHNKTIIVSSHLLDEIEKVATRMIIIDKGKKIMEGDTASLFNPADTLVELETDDENAIEKLLSSSWKNRMEPGGENIILKMHAADIPLLAKDLVDMDIPILNLSKKHSLESLFIRLTSEQASPGN